MNFQAVKQQNTPLSSSQGLKTVVKNLEPGRKREYSKHASDHPFYIAQTAHFYGHKQTNAHTHLDRQ